MNAAGDDALWFLSRWRSRKRLSILCIAAVAAMQLTGCAARDLARDARLPLRAPRERLPAVLDYDKPRFIERWELDRYTCARRITMICDGLAGQYLQCRCPSMRSVR
jgi:hypothetical protein